MSVLMTLRVTGDPKGIEATAPQTLKAIVDRAKAHGVIRHRFYGSDNEILGCIRRSVRVSRAARRVRCCSRRRAGG